MIIVPCMHCKAQLTLGPYPSTNLLFLMLPESNNNKLRSTYFSHITYKLLLFQVLLGVYGHGLFLLALWTDICGISCVSVCIIFVHEHLASREFLAMRVLYRESTKQRLLAGYMISQVVQGKCFSAEGRHLLKQL